MNTNRWASSIVFITSIGLVLGAQPSCFSSGEGIMEAQLGDYSAARTELLQSGFQGNSGSVQASSALADIPQSTWSPLTTMAPPPLTEHSTSRPANTSLDLFLNAWLARIQSLANVKLSRNADQVFTGFLGNSDVFVMSDEDSELLVKEDNKAQKKFLCLQKGLLIIDAGKDSFTVVTPAGNVAIAAGSAVVLDIRPGLQACIRNIGGNNGSQTLVGSEFGKEAVSLAAGEELIVNLGDQAKEELIAADGRSDQMISGSIQIADRPAIKRKFSVQRYVNDEIIIAGRTIRIVGRLERRACKRFVSHVSSAIRSGHAQPKIASNASKNLAEKVKVLNLNENPEIGRPLQLLVEPGTAIHRVNKNTLDLKAGTVFVDIPDAITIKTALATINAHKGKVLLIEVTSGSLRIKDCGGLNATIVNAGKSMLSAVAGTEILILDHNPSVEEIQPKDGVGRRHIAVYPLDEQKKAIVGDFDIVSLLSSSLPIQKVRNSGAKSDKQLLEKMLKTATAIKYVTAWKGRYQKRL